MTPTSLWRCALPLTLAACHARGLQDVRDALEAAAPTARLEATRLTRIGWDGVAADLVLALDNPNAVRVVLDRWAWQIDVDGRPLLSGVQPEGAVIDAQGTSQVTLPVELSFQTAASLLPNLRERTEIPLGLQAEVGVRTPFGPVRVPVDLHTTVPMLHVPRVELLGLRMGSIDLLRQQATVNLVVGLSHRFADTARFEDVHWAFRLDNRDLVSGHLDELATVAPGPPHQTELPVTFNLAQAGALVLDHLQRKRPIQAGFVAEISVSTPWGSLPLRVDERSLVPFVDAPPLPVP